MEEGTQETKPEHKNTVVGEKRISADPKKFTKWMGDDKTLGIRRIPDHHRSRHGKRTKGRGRLKERQHTRTGVTLMEARRQKDNGKGGPQSNGNVTYGTALVPSPDHNLLSSFFGTMGLFSPVSAFFPISGNEMVNIVYNV